MGTYKLLAIDLDNTLLTRKKEVTEKNLLALRRARKAGVRIVYASGRHLAGVNTILKIVGNDDYCISSGGAVITDRNEKICYSCCVAPKTTYELMQMFEREHIYYQVYPPCEDFITPVRTPATDEYEKNCGCHAVIRPDIGTHKDLQSTKLLMIDSYENLMALRERLAARFPELYLIFSQPDHLEVLDPSVSKGKALEYLCGLTDIKPEEIIAMGDAEIDTTMLRFAGVAAVPANADPEIKEIADYVAAADCDHDAVAEIINKYIFGEEL